MPPPKPRPRSGGASRPPPPPQDPVAAAREAHDSLRALLVVQERIVTDRLSSLIAAAETRESLARALQGIVLDTLGETEALTDVLDQWERTTGEFVRPRERTPDLFELLGSFLDVKRRAAQSYARAAESAPTPEIAARLRKLQEMASEHVAILLALLGETR